MRTPFFDHLRNLSVFARIMTATVEILHLSSEIERNERMPAAHGTRQRYAERCRCEPCRAAQAKYMRDYKDRRLAIGGAKLLSLAAVDKPAPQPVSRGPGDNERAVREECAGLSLSDDRPAMVAQAVTLARILDNPKSMAMWPTTSRQLTAILNDLRGNSKKRTRSRLASVQRMVTPGESTG